MKKTSPEYETILLLLSKAEMAARNEEWKTCGSMCRRCMEKAFQIAKEKADAAIGLHT